MANLVVMPRRDVESKAKDNPVTAALRRALTLAQDVRMASGTLQVNHKKSRKFRLWRELETEACMS